MRHSVRVSFRNHRPVRPIERSSVARRATDDDLDTVVRVLVDSHVDYAWERWALPWDDRRERLDLLYRTDLELVALRVGEVWVTDCGRSVAVWLPAMVTPELDSSAIAERERAAMEAFGERHEIVDLVDRAIDVRRPACDWYLATMGTVPGAQRSGLGTEVLRPRLARLDDAAASACLETSDPANLGFYSRLGFEVVAELDDLPSGAPTTWVMQRNAVRRRGS
jgi:ribosomal protein S18 acetylase RimI-like enzyme